MKYEDKYLATCRAIIVLMVAVMIYSIPLSPVFVNQTGPIPNSQLLVQSQIESCDGAVHCNIRLPAGVLQFSKLSSDVNALLFVDSKVNLTIFGAGINQTIIEPNPTSQTNIIRIVHSQNITVENMTINALVQMQGQNSLATGIDIEGSRNVRITNVEVLNAAAGISVGSDSSFIFPSSNVTIENSYIHSVTLQGIGVSPNTHTLLNQRIIVRNNQIFDGGTVGIEVAASSTVALLNNYVRNFNVGIRIGSYDSTGPVSSLTIDSNSITLSKCYGILINRATNVSINSNQLADNSLSDCFREPVGLLIYTFLDSSYNYYTSNITVIHNTFSDDQTPPTQKIGIIVKEDGYRAVTNAIVLDNKIEGGTSKEICRNDIASSNLTFDQCLTR